MTDLLHRPTVDEWKAFEDYERSNRLSNYRVCCLVAAFFMPAGFTLDYIDYGVEGMVAFLPARMVSAAALIGLYFVLKLPFGRHHIDLLGLAVAVPPIAAIAWMIAHTGGAESPYYAGLNLVTLGAGLLMRWRTIDSLIVCFSTIAAYFIATWAHGSVDESRALGNNLYFLVVNSSIVVIGTYLYTGLRFREYRSHCEVKASRSELQDANQRLEQQYARLKELDQAKNNFFANISHELRTPLTLLVAPLETLLHGAERTTLEEQQRLLKTMHANALRLLRLINDLLDLARSEVSSIRVNWTPMDLPSFMKDMEVALHGAAFEKSLHIKVHAQSGIRGVELDPEKLERIVINLLGNAVKFTDPGGSIQFTARLDGSHLILVVEDTGVGIDQQHLEHIFDRFWQVDASSRRRYQGAGIGLSLVKEFAEAMGGSVRAESQLGAWTRMIVTLPYKPCPVPHAPGTVGGAAAAARIEDVLRHVAPTRPATLSRDPADTVQETNTLAPAGSGLGLKPKILVAEDEPDMRQFLTIELAGHFEVGTVANGADAVREALANPPDVLLSDMMMPEKDGLEVCKDLRAAEAGRDIPIVLLTARADEQTRLECLDAGATDFITKPFSPVELMVKLRNLAELSSRRRELHAEKVRLQETLRKLRETEALLLTNDKLVSLGRMSAGLIHEINNPMNFIRQAVLLLQGHARGLTGDAGNECRETLADVLDGVDRVIQIINDLRGFASPVRRTDDLVDLSRVVATALRFFSHHWPAYLRPQCDVAEDLLIQGNSSMLVQVLVNLVQNSIDAMADKTYPDGGLPQLWISGHREGDRVLLTVKDNGPGVPEELAGQVFDPFFTTKDVGKGLGLGLSICFRIITDHHGQIRLRNDPGKGCEFELEFPAAKEIVPDHTTTP